MNCGICGNNLTLRTLTSIRTTDYIYGACYDCAGKTIRAAIDNKGKHQPGCDGSGSHKNGCANGPIRN